MTTARSGPGLGPLEEILGDASVTEVLVNGGGGAWVERSGRLEPVHLDLDEAAVRAVVERVIAPLGLRLDRSSPVVDARLPDGSRLHAVVPPVAIEGTCLAIRRFPSGRVALSAFGVRPELEGFLRWAVQAGWNLLVAGGTGAGKTTLVNALGAFMPRQERIVTIEETAELRLDTGNVVRLEARPPNAEGAGGLSIRDLVRAGLRLRPDRLIVGEVRGAEAFDMVQALNTGHDGSLCTVHANGCEEAVTRLVHLVLVAGTGLPFTAAAHHVAGALDAVVHVTRRRDGARVVSAVAELARSGPAGQTRMLFGPGPDGRAAPAGRLPGRPTRRPAPPADEGWFRCGA